MTQPKTPILAVLAFAVLAAAGCATSSDMSPASAVKLSGAQEVPAVTTMASGSGSIMVGSDHAVSGSVTTVGIEGKAAHIHQAGKGMNGPVVVPLTKTGDATWSVPAGIKLTDEQYTSYQVGNMYVNVHSAANPGGEIRGQLNSKN